MKVAKSPALVSAIRRAGDLALLFLLLLGLGWPLMAAGCATTDPGTIRVDSVAPLLERVCTRHDGYVNADPTLSPAERSTYLDSSEALRRLMRAASGGGASGEIDSSEPIPDPERSGAARE